MTNPAEGTVLQYGNSSLAALRRFTELVLAELNDSAQRTNSAELPFAILCSSEDTCNPNTSRRQPFGLVFQEGQRAVFNLPAGRRFVIEYLKISRWGASPQLLVQLTTKSQSMFRNMTLCSAFDDVSVSGCCTITPASPLLLWESTANTLLFSHGDLRHSATVPPDTCVQMWGYLEPAGFGAASQVTRKAYQIE